jgi:REP element-mobilizing transposase RayT
MARQWRIEYEGAYYHVLSRGNEKGNIVVDHKDRMRFLETLGQFSDKYQIDIYAYVLMDNHYHLILKTQKANLSLAMQWFGLTYTRRFNIRHNRSGHLFQGRFKCMLIENDRYLMQLSCYIHRNPLRAGMVKRLIDYRWSSYLAYAYGQSHPKWLKTDLILSQFNVRDKHQAYRVKMQEYAGEEHRVLEDIHHGIYLGTKEFTRHIKEMYLNQKPDKELPQQKAISRVEEGYKMLEKGCKFLKCDLESFRKSKRIKRSDKGKRDLLLYLLWEQGIYKGKEIGDLFGLGYSAVSRRAYVIRETMAGDRRMKKEYEKLKSIIKI